MALERRCNQCKDVLIECQNWSSAHKNKRFYKCSKCFTKYANNRARAVRAENSIRGQAQRTYEKQYYLENKERLALDAKARHLNIKIAAMEAYGGTKCACCGEHRLEFLSLDHINGRSENTPVNGLRGCHLYRWLRKNDYPKDVNLRVLCHNCNLSLGANKYCPHEKERENGGS